MISLRQRMPIRRTGAHSPLLARARRRRHAHSTTVVAHLARLLCPRRERPRRRAADQRDEIAPFHCPMPPVLSDRKDSTPKLRQETAALRDFNPANVSCGSITSIPRCLRYVWLYSKSGDKADMETLRVRVERAGLSTLND